MFRIVKTDLGVVSIPEEALSHLSGIGYRIDDVPCRSAQDIIDQAADADALVVMTENVTREVMEALPKLKVIARVGVGVDTIDVAAATELGILVTNVPDANFNEVATHALALILDQLRRITVFNSSMQKGEWAPSTIGAGMRRPSALSLGLVGFGRSAQRLTDLVRPLGFEVHVYARPKYADSIIAMGGTPMSLDELFETSDIVSLHIPVTEETRGLIDRTRLSRMKTGAVLINVSRGGLVDEHALAERVQAGHIAGAGFDVFEAEPAGIGSPFHGVDGITLTPHVAYLSKEAAAEAASTAVSEIGRVFRNERPINLVNCEAE
ncbi:C-terminal binding protein [Brevibacterium sp. SMBL_HHYL_HB1]|jgi:D-3-phosphoglycerate dehydrogenase|uniref:C-terminal binding protein n=1 Tax=Brevibacterium sp. SMBL_HHYL_HB1 TaxID=2777556 RepID=UPI001BACF107|nr:C-terminal binding protein [Brevibacterium sp. SMBL_HHYL_HB1]QUL78038.1 C-terminal binding protein [Brevibacterium sp. SMBL_HHYL_HB1]